MRSQALSFLVLLVLICACSQIQAPVSPSNLAAEPMEGPTGPLNKAEFDHLNDFVRGALLTEGPDGWYIEDPAP